MRVRGTTIIERKIKMRGLGTIINALAIVIGAVLNNLSLVGNILIFCVGINLVWPRTIKVANLLPSLLVAVALTGIL